MSENGARNGLQAQWNVDRTVNDALQVAREFVKIATQDNVQPLALLACERFGITLPICSATRSFVAQKTKPRQEPIMLQFAKAMIKNAGGESLTRLSSNVAGLNFLALAAAIAPLMPNAEAASTIQRMLDSSASDKSLVPPEHHVEAILDCLDSQLALFGFLDKCYEWDYWLRQTAKVYSKTDHRYPSPHGIEQVVSALRSLARLGEDNIETAIFTCHSCVPWMTAFVEWSLGITPILCNESGTVIVAQPESKVTIVIPTEKKAAEPVKVELFLSTGSLYECLRFEPSTNHDGYLRRLSGMVTLETHSRQTLQALGTATGIGLRASLECLHYAIPQTIELIYTSVPLMDDYAIRVDVEKFLQGKNPNYWMAYLPKYFPDKERVYTTMRTYLGSLVETPTIFRALKTGTTGTSQSIPILL